jgi:hypothetical protein
MLAYAEKHGLEDVVSWLPGGKGFSVHNHPEFCKHVLKPTFAHSNFKSFEKQLNNWGFQRSVNEDGSKSYSNPSFIRGRKSLCQTMTSKSTLKKAAEVDTNSKKSATAQPLHSAAVTSSSPVVAAHQAAVLSVARQRHALAATVAAGGFLNNGSGMVFGHHGNGVSMHTSPSTTSIHDIQMMLLRHKQALLLQQQRRQQHIQQHHHPEVRGLASLNMKHHLLQQHQAATAAVYHSCASQKLDETRDEDKERAAVLLALRRGG